MQRARQALVPWPGKQGLLTAQLRPHLVSGKALRNVRVAAGKLEPKKQRQPGCSNFFAQSIAISRLQITFFSP